MKKPFLNSTSLRADRRQESGSATLIALGIVTITALVLATALIEASHRYRISHQSTRWAQAGQAAEAGAEIAMMCAQSNSWVANGWSAPPGAPGAAAVTQTFTIGTDAGGQPITANVAVDSLSMGGGNWLRIRSIGSATVFGGRVAGIDENDVTLRKLSFLENRYTLAALAKPQSMRMVEILAQPNSLFTMALLLNKQLTMSGGAYIDSFNSSNSAYSTNGLYVASKRESNANVGINNTEGLTDLKSTYIYGSLAYSGAAPANTNNVTGGVTTPFSKTVPPVTAPTWTSYNASPSVVGGTATLTGGTQASPALYKLSSLNLSGSNFLTLAPYASGQQSYIQIWVTGDFITSGSAYILQQAGVHVTFYVQGNVNISGGSIENQTGYAADCIMNVVNPPTGTTQTVTISGSGTMIAAIDAPGAAFDISGASNLSGAFIGNTMNISGGAGVHYDQALANSGGSGGAYTVASEIEGVR